MHLTDIEPKGKRKRQRGAQREGSEKERTPEAGRFDTGFLLIWDRLGQCTLHHSRLSHCQCTSPALATQINYYYWYNAVQFLLVSSLVQAVHRGGKDRVHRACVALSPFLFCTFLCLSLVAHVHHAVKRYNRRGRRNSGSIVEQERGWKCCIYNREKESLLCLSEKEGMASLFGPAYKPVECVSRCILNTCLPLTCALSSCLPVPWALLVFSLCCRA